jgi:hypothetical protein
VAIAALAVALGGVAYAAIPNTGGLITGCYDSGGNLKVIDTSTVSSCPKGYTSLNWNQTGPQGPAGVNGVSGYEIVTETVPYNATPVHQVLSCPAGKKALSEGQQGGTTWTDFPLADGSGWDWYESNGPAILYVVCAYAS